MYLINGCINNRKKDGLIFDTFPFVEQRQLGNESGVVNLVRNRSIIYEVIYNRLIYLCIIYSCM